MLTILDTDIGSDIDDTWALAMLLRCPELDPKLVLTCSGDTVYRAKVAAKLLAVAGRTDVPVGMGPSAGEALEFQGPWIDGYDLDSYPGTIHQDGIGAMIDLIMGSPEPVTIIGIGPSTNIARALEREPRIAAKCRFVGMYGSVDRGYSDKGPTPETNVRLDVPALRAVFAAPWRELLITPLDTCGLVVLDGARYRRIFDADDPLVRAVIDNYRVWASLVSWLSADFFETRSSVLFDTVAVYMAYATGLLHLEPLRLRITDNGMTVRDLAGFEVQAALRWHDLDAFYDHLVARLLGAG